MQQLPSAPSSSYLIPGDPVSIPINATGELPRWVLLCTGTFPYSGTGDEHTHVGTVAANEGLFVDKHALQGTFYSVPLCSFLV